MSRDSCAVSPHCSAWQVRRVGRGICEAPAPNPPPGGAVIDDPASDDRERHKAPFHDLETGQGEPAGGRYWRSGVDLNTLTGTDATTDVDAQVSFNPSKGVVAGVGLGCTNSAAWRSSPGFLRVGKSSLLSVRLGPRASRTSLASRTTVDLSCDRTIAPTLIVRAIRCRRYRPVIGAAALAYDPVAPNPPRPGVPHRPDRAARLARSTGRCMHPLRGESDDRRRDDAQTGDQ